MGNNVDLEILLCHQLLHYLLLDPDLNMSRIETFEDLYL